MYLSIYAKKKNCQKKAECQVSMFSVSVHLTYDLFAYYNGTLGTTGLFTGRWRNN